MADRNARYRKPAQESRNLNHPLLHTPINQPAPDPKHYHGMDLVSDLGTNEQRATEQDQTVRRRDTSKLLRVIDRSASLSSRSSSNQLSDAERRASVLRRRRWYQRGETILLLGLTGVVAAGLLTIILVLMFS